MIFKKMNFKTLITVRWRLSNECTFHAYFFEDSFFNNEHLKILTEVDHVLKNFKMIEYTKTIIDVDIVAPIVKLPLFFAHKSGVFIVYPYDTYGKIPTYNNNNPYNNPYNSPFGNFNQDFVRVKSFYNFLEENNITTSMFNGVWCSL